MMKFSYSNTTQIFFGEGQIAQLSRCLPEDKKVLLLYGGGSIKKNGVYEQVAQALEGHQWGEFSGIEPNPQYDTLMRAVEKIKQEGFDYLLAVGGGSVADGAKFIAAAACFAGDDPWQILTQGAVVAQALPLGCILTLPATGSETNTNSVVNRGHEKRGFSSSKVRPEFAILDPATTLSLPLHYSINGVVDAYVHVMEQYLTYPVNAKVQDRFAEGLLLTLIEEGPKLLTTPDDLEVRANIMWAATQALNGLLGVGVPQDWATHMIGHELTGLYGVDHARSLSIVLPALMDYCRQDKRAKLLQYAERVWQLSEGSEEERIQSAIRLTADFFHRLGAPIHLSEVDLGAEAIDAVIEQLEAHQMFPLGEQGKLGADEVRALLKRAL